ncbi:MAG: tyrosine-type recombinase/integrase [Archaeoglobaceae archaeon]
MSIVKYKNGWLVRVYIQGVRIQKFFKDKALAEVVYNELKKKQELAKIAAKLKGVDEGIANLLGSEIEKGQFIKLKVFWSIYYKWLISHKKKSTIRERVVRWRTIIAKELGEKTLKEITPLVIQNFQQKLLERQSPISVNRTVALLRHMLTIAVRLGYLKEHPLLGKIYMLREKPKKEWTFLSKEAYEKIKTNLPDTYRDFFIFLVFTGARLGEALSLRWKDIIWDAGVAYLSDSKTNRPRVIYLHESIIEMLKHKKENPTEEEKVFKHSDGWFRKAFKATLKKLNLPDIRIHDLRHTFASWLAISGVPIQQIKELLSHTEIRTTMRYAHLNPQVLRDTLNKVFREEAGQDKSEPAKVISINVFLEKKRTKASGNKLMNFAGGDEVF